MVCVSIQYCKDSKTFAHPAKKHKLSSIRAWVSALPHLLVAPLLPRYSTVPSDMAVVRSLWLVVADLQSATIEIRICNPLFTTNARWADELTDYKSPYS